MTAVNVETAEKGLCQLIEDVSEGRAPITIMGDRGKNAVLLSEEDWNAIQETLYLNSIPGMAESIVEADREPLSECATYDPNEAW